MLCPVCSRQLNKIKVSTREGGHFEVDHCGYCGGTWFDPYEINRIPFHEVVNLAGLTVLPNDKKFNSGTKMPCPNDHNILEKFAGDAVPAKVRLFWCRKCLGIWATQKDLVEFKKHQEETISAYDTGSRFFPSLSVVFIPVVTFLFLMALTFSTVSNLQNAQESRIIAESQISNLNLTFISKNSVLLSFNTSNPVISQVLFGTSSLELSSIEMSKNPSTIHNIVLPGLLPDRDYIYKIRITDTKGKTFTSEIKIFHNK